jgi:tRNA threonylcarbamoyladenosine biosynthesis protein TsaE
MTFTLATVDDTLALGREIGNRLTAGDLVILSGSLGAGKTTLTKGIAAGMGVRGLVTSPTFVIARVHRPAGPGATRGEGAPADSDAARGSDTIRGQDASLRPDASSAAGASARPDTAAGVPLVHVDAYRLSGALELDDLDLDTDLAAAAVVIEWGEGVAERLTDDRVHVELTRLPDDTRTATLTPVGASWERRVADITGALPAGASSPYGSRTS